MFESFEVVPAVDLRGGRVVQLVGGDPSTETGYGDPVETARRWHDDGAGTLHIVDLDGAIDGTRANAPIIDRIRTTVDVTIQLGGGIRTDEDARSLLERGIDRIILGTAALETPSLVGDLAEAYPEGILVSLDASGGEVVVAGWQERTGVEPVEAAKRYEELGAAGILYTDVDVEGTESGVRADPVRKMADAIDVPVIASGGVGSIADIRALARAGAAACVVGTALYEGRFSLAEAKTAASKA